MFIYILIALQCAIIKYIPLQQGLRLPGAFSNNEKTLNY